MLNQKPAEEVALLEAISSAQTHLASLDPNTPEYYKNLDQIKILYTILSDLRQDRMTIKNWIPVIAHVGGIVVIVTAEALGHGVFSKAMSLASSFKK